MDPRLSTAGRTTSDDDDDGTNGASGGSGVAPPRAAGNHRTRLSRPSGTLPLEEDSDDEEGTNSKDGAVGQGSHTYEVVVRYRV